MCVCVCVNEVCIFMKMEWGGGIVARINFEQINLLPISEV